MEELYPQGPQTVPADFTRPTAAYKQRAWLAVASLATFVVIYLALAGWFSWSAIRLFRDAADGGDGAVGFVLVGIGAAFLAVFMVKGLFFIRRGGAPDALEVTATEQPTLFAFLHRLADEIGAPRPHRVFLSARVNAAVFYDLSLVNLLLPSRKNLEIGLPLMNVLTLSELKAVLAHEFGHFAQKSMAIGSWVYIAQQIAEQVVARRDALDRFLQTLSRLDPRIAWIGWLFSLIVWSIRSLMDTLLRLVVLAQRALSRQMEFQADLVAVSLTGSDELVHALHKLQAADQAWDQTLSFLGQQLAKGKLPDDLFAVQTAIIDKTATILADPHFGKVPPRETDEAASHRLFKNSFAQPPQMWSTHPANADREQNAKQCYLTAAHDPRSPWLLLSSVDEVKQQVVKQLIGEREAEPADADEIASALNERYGLRQYHPGYRGAYLKRPLTRHSATAAALYQAEPLATDRQSLMATLEQLYSPEFAADLAQLEQLNEEHGTLVALKEGHFKATGGRIMFRGQQIARRQLAKTIAAVAAERREVEQRIVGHDQRCRSVHLAIAEQLGGGWAAYHRGLTQVLHYAEHSLADLRDAQGLVGNVLAIITADGTVYPSELKRLLVAANGLFGVMSALDKQRDQLKLDSSILAELGCESWSALFEPFKLKPATEQNINEWLKVIDNWVDSMAGPLYALSKASLELLLATEQKLAEQFLQGGDEWPAAPLPSVLPSSYAVLPLGSERKRQRKLGLWDRVQTADGLAPGALRLLIAGAIVGGVLGFGSHTGNFTEVSIYNGLGRNVMVTVGNEQYAIRAFSAREFDMTLDEQSELVTATNDGQEIERFKPELHGHGHHYVYNVAAASPLVEWTAVYGSAQERPERYLGAPRWITSDADVFFSDPPESVKTKGGGATRDVLQGFGDADPQRVLGLLEEDSERLRVAQLHAQWDEPQYGHTEGWQQLFAE